MVEKISLSQGGEEHAPCNLDSPTTEVEGCNDVSHSKGQPPDVVPGHVDEVIKLQIAKSGRTNHRVTEEIVAQRAARINEREAPHMPRAMLSHQE